MMIDWKIIEDIHQNSVDHGWHDKEKNDEERIFLYHTEISEAGEEYRNNRPPLYFIKNKKIETDFSLWQGEKPEGMAVELVDCVIRILDDCGKLKYDISKDLRGDYETKDNWLMSGSTFPAFLTHLHYLLSCAYVNKNAKLSYLASCIEYIIMWCKKHNWDFETALKYKHEYNKTREYRHGGKAI